MGSKGRPYRSFSIDGFEVLVGRGDEENDALTLEVAAPEDFWLHIAGGLPGSHVVVRNPEHLAELPATVVEQAAALAAWYSKARDQRRATVHLSRVSDVRKRRGAPAGEVMLERWTTVRVSRRPDDQPAR
jgi:predicted ribosome quality control (RQC) complex YloA/Tae2 family protein